MQSGRSPRRHLALRGRSGAGPPLRVLREPAADVGNLRSDIHRGHPLADDRERVVAFYASAGSDRADVPASRPTAASDSYTGLARPVTVQGPPTGACRSLSRHSRDTQVWDT